MLRVLAALAVLAVLVSDSGAAPGFDCDKATSDVEKYICWDDGPITGSGSQWLDRQLARFFAIAKEQAPEAKRDRLIADQRRFLKERDACFGNGRCRIEDVYRKRLKDVARAAGGERSFQVYDGVDGQLQIARYGATASVSIWTSSDGYACQFEEDDLPVVNGTAQFRDDDSGCRLEVSPLKGALRVRTEGFCGCGAHATMEGVYGLAW